MNRTAAWMLLAATAITSVGCSTSGNTLARGQGPDHACPTGDCHMGQGGPMGHGPVAHDWSGGGFAGADGCWHGPMSGPDGASMMGGGMMGGGMMGGGMMGPGGRPQGHTINYTTCMPQNLKYPPTNVPPSVVQYPYYTTKGPSDFFMK